MSYQKLSALYYEVSKPIGTSLDGDLEFYEKHIANVDNILEAGVGTGRLLVPYLEKGINIEGIDSSSDMILKCKDACLLRNLDSVIIEGNVETYNFDKKYEAIIIPTGTFCLFDNIENVLKNFRKHLSEDGFIMFDIIFPNNFKEGSHNVYPLDVSKSEKIVLTSSHISVNWVNQFTEELLKYDLWRDGSLVESELQTFKLYWYSLRETLLMLEGVGFDKVEIWGDYSDSYDPNINYEALTLKAYKS